jgi:GR25 family glycosyltransferase involved in LPS biosynthesis
LVDFFSRYSTCEIIPKLSINMETYPHLVCSQIGYHIFLLHKYLVFVGGYAVLNQTVWYIINCAHDWI